MLKPKDLFNELERHNIKCWCGVPDSLLKSFCAYISENVETTNHTITANEGNAIALAAGHYLATGNIACVYMQNSGLGNCINPLLSLTDENVYNIPVLMFIGWRGEPLIKDEPQHFKQGLLTIPLLNTLGIKYDILPYNIYETKILLDNAFIYMQETRKPFVFIVRKNTFEDYQFINKRLNNYKISRQDSIEKILKHLSISDVVVSSTGFISREVYEIKEKLYQSHKQDFLTIGSMGHTSSIALGIALEKPERNVFCFDGDGSVLMHHGALAVNAQKKMKNFRHIIFNNEAHDSVGAQPTAMSNENIVEVAKNCGYTWAKSIQTYDELEDILPEFINNKGTNLLEIKVKCGANKKLSRPKESPAQNKLLFMENLQQIKFVYRGAIENLSKIITLENTHNILIFTGKNSYQNIKSIVEEQLIECDITYYNDFLPNPKKEDIDKAINIITPDKYDLIIAIGGGSVIDFAKAYKYYTNFNKKFIAIPTTCGTGSEATQFAVLYYNGIKKSLDNIKLLPDYSICDSQFVINNPKHIKASTAMDTFCQAIESYFSLKSTNSSRGYAKESIEICRDYIISYINSDNNFAAEKMMEAAYKSGQAINISKTTAAHAISYKMTSEYNIPHGYAVSLTIAQILEYNKNISNSDCNDKRGVDFVKNRINEIYDILNITDAITYFKQLFANIGLNIPKNIDYKLIAQSVNEERLNNNPRAISKNDIVKILSDMENLKNEI